MLQDLEHVLLLLHANAWIPGLCLQKIYTNITEAYA